MPATVDHDFVQQQQPARPVATAGAAPAFLSDGGAMGALMRAHDWSGSSLGPPAGWPLPLRTVVRLMLNTGHPMYIWWGPDLACLYNDAYSESIGPERHPGSLGLPAQAVWGEIWHIIGGQIEQVMSGRGATWNVNHLVPITRHGRREDVYWTYSYSPIDDETAATGVGGVLVVCNETTQHVLAARQLAAERDRLAQLFEQAPSFMALLRGPQHRIEIANPGYMRLVGDRPVLGKTVAEALPDAVEQGYLALLDQVFSSGQTYTASGARYAVQVAPHGPIAERYVDFVYQPIKGTDRQVEAIFVQGVDVTERTRADAALRHSEASFRSALRAGRLGSWETDYATMTRTWSQEGMDLFGLSLPGGVGQVGGDADEYLAAMHPDDRHRGQQFRAIADRQDAFPAEYRIVRPDGSTLWLSGHGLVLARGADGRAQRLISIMADATERKQAEEVLRDADQAKDKFIATLAHELRNPLAPIRNAVDVLRRTAGDDPRAAWCHDVIDRQARQMTRLLDDLLDVSRISRNQLQLQRQPLRLGTIIDQAIEIAQPLIDAGRHSFSVQMAEPDLLLEGDLVRLAQVFSNLLINAAKYTQPEGRIALIAQRQQDQVVVTVTDTGVGLTTEHMALIFQIFGQVESALSRSQGGQGIGLSLARGLVELHGGVISVRSEGLGRGSQFEVRLPLPATLSMGKPEAAAHGPAPAGRRYRILIADDLADTADSLALLLAGLGHEVSVAYDGAQALAMAETLRPDVALLDLGMPKVSGDEVCRRIRSLPWGQQVVLIAQTGWGQPHDRQRTADAGFDHHVVKPVDPSTLQALFARDMRNSTQAR